MIDTVSFAVSTDPALFAELTLAGTEHIILFKKFEEKRVDFFGDFDLEKIRKFILANELRLVTVFNRIVKLFSFMSRGF